MIDTLRKLYLLQVSSSGIPLSVCSTLTQEEKALLFEDGKKFFLRPEQRKKIHVVLTGGVFDVLHIGHILTLTEAKTHGDVLVVAIAKDDHIRQKGREPVHSQEYRRVMVEALKPVDIALVGMDNPQDLLKSVRPDVIVYGYDQKEFAKPEGVRIVKLDKKIDDSKFKTSKILNTLGL
jgi:cytidyltransferase-like protein